jgi:hypothetical protein
MMYTHNHATRWILAMTVCTLALLPGLAHADNDPTGDWDIVIDMGGTPVEATLNVTKNDDDLAGKLVSAMGEAELSNVTFDGTNLSFTQTFGEGDTALKFEFKGAMDSNDAFSGMLSSDMGEMGVTGVRHGTGAGIVGTWTLTSDSELGVMEFPFVVKEDMTATYSTFPVVDLKHEGDAVTFGVTVEVEGTEYPLSFEGAFENPNTVKGDFIMDGGPVADVVIARIVDFYGTWNVTSESSLGTLERVLIVNEDGTGTYNDFAISSFALDGNKVTFDVTLDINGQEAPLSFKGTFEDTELTGDFAMDGENVAEVTGTKQ